MLCINSELVYYRTLARPLTQSFIERQRKQQRGKYCRCDQTTRESRYQTKDLIKWPLVNIFGKRFEDSTANNLNDDTDAQADYDESDGSIPNI